MSKLPSQAQVREKVGHAGNLLAQARLFWHLLKDQRVPGWVKLIPLAGAAYLIWPIDIISDLVPGLGQLDDLGVLLLSFKFFIDLSPVEVVREHLGRVTGRRRASEAGAEMPTSDDYIDAPYRVIGADDDGVREP